MCEPKIEPSISYVLGGRKIICLLVRCHRVPNTVTLLVAPDIIQLRTRVEDCNINYCNGDEGPITPMIYTESTSEADALIIKAGEHTARRIILLIDLRGDD